MSGAQRAGETAGRPAPRLPEILAPAGDADALRAAVYSGADAVYLGLTRFSARRSAGNFTPEELLRAVGFCHARGVRVYLALNTLLYPGELAAAADAVRSAADAGADAVIVQDLAAAALVRRMAPGLTLHGSTQMSVHTPAGARQLERMGFARAILARELSLDEIRAIRRQSGIELEVFVHGALCMSVSGQCYMSAFLGGRSGNRGSCAGSCRLPFSASGGQDGAACHLSLKDLSVIGRLPELAAAGVCSAKIEGRLRGPEYVAGAVDACLAAREGRPYDGQLLRDAFSRSGFTSAYLDGRPGREMFGVRTAGDSAASREAMPRLRGLYRRERPAVPVWFLAKFGAEFGKASGGPDGAETGEAGSLPGLVALTARDAEGRAVTVQSGRPAQTPEKDPLPAALRALEKTGGTPFYAAGLEVSGTPGYLPGSEWNELRRAALERLLALRETPRPHPCAAPVLPAAGHKAAKEPLPLRARFCSLAQLPGDAGLLNALEYLILPIAEAGAVPERLRAKTILELPRGMFGGLEEDTARRIAACRGEGFAGFEAGNIAHLALWREAAGAKTPPGPAQQTGALPPLFSLRQEAAETQTPPGPAQQTGALPPLFSLRQEAAETQTPPGPAQQTGVLPPLFSLRQEAAETQTPPGPAQQTGALPPLFGGFGLNLTNQLAAAEYAAQGLCSLTLAPELAASDMPAVGPPAIEIPTGAMVYGHMPLMLTRACPLQNVTDCARCDRAGFLTDRKGMRFPVRCALDLRSIHNPIPLYMGDKPGALAVDFGLAYFSIEKAARAEEVLRLLLAGAPFDGPFTRGLYFKGTS